MQQSDDRIGEMVRHKYAAIARAGISGCGTSCCAAVEGAAGEYNMIGDAYHSIAGYVPGADLGLSCGVPVEHARLAPGQTVLDLGSGAGLDVFVARHHVGAGGHAIGVDMTAEMIARARQGAHDLGYRNVEFRLGEIERLPVLSDSVDVVLSNCVLNLVPDKPRAFAEIFRVLKPGGHFCISDIVASRELPQWLNGIAEAYAGCVAGAVPRERYLECIRHAGFGSIEVASERRIEVPAEWIARLLTKAQRAEAAENDLHILSVTVTAAKPLA